MDQPVTFTRRAALKTLSAGLGAFAVWPTLSDEAAEAYALLQKTNAPPKLVFLTPAQYATLDALTETIIPTDDHSPGARAARVADYIDLLLSESNKETQVAWTAGLMALDQASRQRFQAPFAKLAPARSVELVTEISAGELDPVAKDAWGIPVLRFNFRFGDNELKMANDMADTPRRCSMRRGPRTSAFGATC